MASMLRQLQALYDGVLDGTAQMGVEAGLGEKGAA
jgi:hypothetical protein